MMIRVIIGFLRRWEGFQRLKRMSRRTGCCVMNIQRHSNESGSRGDPLFHLAFFCFRPPHLLHLQRNQDNGDKECDTVCDRSSKEDSVDPEKQW